MIQSAGVQIVSLFGLIEMKLRNTPQARGDIFGQFSLLRFRTTRTRKAPEKSQPFQKILGL